MEKVIVIWRHIGEDAEDLDIFLGYLKEPEDDILDAIFFDEIEEKSELVSSSTRCFPNKGACEECKDFIISKENFVLPKKYWREVSHGGLVVPSTDFFRAVVAIFAQLDHLQKFVQ